MTDVRKRIIVRGVVQGVGFRFFVRRHAERMSIRGYVRNQADGSVLVEAESDAATLAGFIALLREGPSHAHVDDVESVDIPVLSELDFRIE